MPGLRTLGLGQQSPATFLHLSPMLSVSAASRLVVSGARRAVVVAGQRCPVQAIRRTPVRGIQSIAQTDRVSWKLSISCILKKFAPTFFPL